jgi:hypothetical protein
VRLALLLVIAACSGRTPSHHREDPPRPPAPPEPAGHTIPQPEPVHVAPSGNSGRPSHPIEVTLRSTPPGATAAVDGTIVGTTPAYWGGDADGHEHEFTFDLKGFALARYRFVPVTSGVIHARLDPIAEETDAGVSPESAAPGAGAVLVNPPPAANPVDGAPAPVPVLAPDAALAAPAPPAPIDGAVVPSGPTP